MEEKIYKDGESIIEQKPATKNQITAQKPDIIKNSNVLQGYIANSFNGGFLKPIAFAPIMAGTRVSEYRLRFNIKMLTPKTPVYQKLKMSVKTFFVPNSRVWTNWEKFSAQKGGATVSKVKTIPNIGGMSARFLNVDEPNMDWNSIIYTDTDLYRDSWVSTYLPKFQTGQRSTLSSPAVASYPQYSILPIRGFKAIYNDYLRNKEYDQPLTEYKTDTVTTEEQINTFNMYLGQNIDQSQLRGRRQNSYYTDYRTELLGEQDQYEFVQTNNMLSSLVEYEKLVSQSRNEATNAQLNDWDIIAKEHGSRKLTEGKVQLLSEQIVGLNYQHVVQSAYNINEQIQEDFQLLGQEGAYCYTEVSIPCCQMQEFIEDGYLHVVAQVTSDSVFESGFDRTLLNVNSDEIYRPEYKELIDDVLYDIEKNGTKLQIGADLKKITGYKRKFSEYFKLPNAINGDITTYGAYITKHDSSNNNFKVEMNDLGVPVQLQSKNTFQFFEVSDKYSIDDIPKNIWQDYTDLLINKNQAIENETENISKELTSRQLPFTRVKGDNQLFMIGIQTLVADMPIDENIKNNYKTWGQK